MSPVGHASMCIEQGQEPIWKIGGRQLGIRPDEASSHGNSRKGPWRMAKSLAISMAMTIQWLTDLGLFSLSKRWSKLAPVGRTA